MYETLGASEIVSGPDAGKVEFRVFFPDNTVDPLQYSGDARPRIKRLSVVGSFQDQLPGVTKNWEANPRCDLALDPAPFANRGRLWTYRTQAALAEGFYEYKYHVEFEDGTWRWVGDPCARYGGSEHENAAFTVGGRRTKVNPLAVPRRPLRDLLVYELMIDDFADRIRAGRAPVEAVADELQYLKDLGVTAIEFMPWTSWPGGDFSWGYNPVNYFAAEYRYTLDPANDADKLFHLKQLVNRCHALGIAVILDCVFNHVDLGARDRGFAYYWLYQNPEECPYVGNYAGGGFLKDLNYANGCTNEYIFDVCKYWIDVFRIDGIRFDYTLGFYKTGRCAEGLARVLSDVRDYVEAERLAGRQDVNFVTILEHLSDNRFDAIDVVNSVGATGCWFDPLMFRAMEGVRGPQFGGGIDHEIMRPLDAGKDFAPGRGPVTYVENHDHTRLAERAGGRGRWFRTQPWAIALMTLPGTPMVYNGQEFGEDYFVPEKGDGRVGPRPLRWDRRDDDTGKALRGLYQKLAKIRREHPALRSANFYPTGWQDWQQKPNPQGYGVDSERDVLVYHRWGDAADGAQERFIVVLNFSEANQTVGVPFSADGEWEDLLSGWKPVVSGGRMTMNVGSNWGHVFYRKG